MKKAKDMRHPTIRASIFLLMMAASTAGAQTFSGRLTSSFYTFERSDTIGVSSTHARGYQAFQFDLKNRNFMLRTFGQLENDLSTQLAGDGKVRMYNLYLQWRDTQRRAEVSVGRQSIYSGVAVGTIDGAQLKYKVKSWLRLKAFGGGLLPANQRLKLVDDVSDNFMAGGQALIFPTNDLKIGVSYFNKKQTRASYRAIRADSVGNVFEQLVEPDNQAYQFASLDARWAPKGETSLYTRSDFDVYSKKFTRAEFSARTAVTTKLSVNAAYTFRSPRLPRNSIFSLFNVENNHELEGGLYYRAQKNIGVYGNFAGIFYDQENSLRGSVGVDLGYGGISYVVRGGYAGSLNGVNGSFYYPMYSGKLMPNVMLSCASYKLDTDASETESLLSGAFGLMVRPHKLVTIDGQVQVLNNRYYSNDVRFLMRLQYVFFSRI